MKAQFAVGDGGRYRIDADELATVIDGPAAISPAGASVQPIGDLVETRETAS